MTNPEEHAISIMTLAETILPQISVCLVVWQAITTEVGAGRRDAKPEKGHVDKSFHSVVGRATSSTHPGSTNFSCHIANCHFQQMVSKSV